MSSNISRAAGREPNYYPMAENIPFTRVIKGQPGDPVYVEPGREHVSENVLKIAAEKFADLLQRYGNKIEANRVLRQQFNERAQALGLREPLFTSQRTTCLLGVVSAIAIPILLLVDHQLGRVELYGSLAASVCALIGGVEAFPDTPKILHKTASVMNEYLRSPMPPCDMKLTEDAIKRIRDTRQMPQELQDILTYEKVIDPVMFLDRTGLDKTMTIFERSSAIILLNKQLPHPISRRILSYNDLVELPELKRQLEELSQDPDIQDS